MCSQPMSLEEQMQGLGTVTRVPHTCPGLTTRSNDAQNPETKSCWWEEVTGVGGERRGLIVV